MNIFLRYFSRALVALTSIVTFVLTFLVWIEQSVRFIDLITKKNMGFGKFMLLIAYLIPDLLGIVLPIAFALSCCILLIRLRETNQLTIIQSVGVSLSTIAASVIKVGIGVVAVIYAVSFYLAPYSLRQFKSIQFYTGQDVNRLFHKYDELSLENKIAVFIKKISKNELYGIAVFDQRTPDQQIILQAEKGHLYQNDSTTKLMLEDGERTSLNMKSGAITRFRFKHYESDISLGDLTNLHARDLRAYERYIYELFDSNLFGDGHFLRKKMQAEGHQRVVNPWLTIIFALICFFVITTQRGYRHNSLKNLVSAGFFIMVIQGFNLAMFNLSHKYWVFNIVNYVGIIAILGTLMLLVFRPMSRKGNNG